MAILLRENLTFDQASLTLEDKDGKELYLKGICIEGGVENANKRTYPVQQIASAVRQIDRKSTRLNSSHVSEFRMPSSA